MRIFARGAVTTAASALMVGALALPASATEAKCATVKYSPAGTESFQMCTFEETDHTMWGWIDYYNATGLSQSVTGTLILQKCQAGGVNCVTQAAHSIDEWVTAGYGFVQYTAERAGVYGYTYRTCSSGESLSGWTWVMSCSTTNPYTP